MTIPVLKDLSQRSASADILKTISILAVVFIHGSHLFPFSPSNLDFDPENLDFFKNAFRFCVPVFLFIWAYFMEKTTIKKGAGNSLARFYKLLIPFMFWSSVYFLLIANFKQLSLAAIISKHLTGYGWSGQYYFIILFQLLLLFSIIRRIALRFERFVPIIYILSILFYGFITYSHWFQIGIIGKLSYRPFFYWMPYVILGILYAHRNIFRFSLPVAVVVISPLLILIEIYYLHPPLENIYMLPGVFITSLVLLSSMQSKLTYENIPPHVGKSIQALANYTLGIFCLNPLIIIILSSLVKRVGFSVQFPGASIVLPLISTVFICSACILLINLIKKIRLGILVAN
ncbi:acyltransferase family protein [Pedobacter hartonius]|uniref:Surface polysaccharide O-acyltransferase, integral membrane enzyme n=1 Tax=Pedobacter hartonius TaxID=425514 RepID=A0A1H4FNY6_9SPHI|nr:Surface polysaccharide O-acyltransferase, integral membrane enzyme [Pedobacter hartonius]